MASNMHFASVMSCDGVLGAIRQVTGVLGGVYQVTSVLGVIYMFGDRCFGSHMSGDGRFGNEMFTDRRLGNGMSIDELKVLDLYRSFDDGVGEPVTGSDCQMDFGRAKNEDVQRAPMGTRC